MSDQKPPQSSILDEFRSLSENLKRTFTTAWQSEERQRIQQELEEGINEVGSTLKSMAAEFEESPAGQEIKRTVADIQNPERRLELETRFRTQFAAAIRSLNAELESILENWGTQKEGAPPEKKEGSDGK